MVCAVCSAPSLSTPAPSEPLPPSDSANQLHGVNAPGLWGCGPRATPVAEVAVVAPDRDQSGMGTARTLLNILRVSEIESRLPGVPAYSVSGTPAENLSIMRRMALNMLKNETTSQGAWPPNARGRGGITTTSSWYLHNKTRSIGIAAQFRCDCPARRP